MPYLISERLLTCLEIDSSKSQFSVEDFKINISRLFIMNEDYDQIDLLKLVYDIYDFNKDRKLYKEDVSKIWSSILLYNEQSSHSNK